MKQRITLRNSPETNSVAKLAKSFGTPQLRKSWRLSLRWNRKLDLGRFLSILLVLVLIQAPAFAAELPGERLGRPLRVHIARGLWWQMLRLHEAIGLMGGADLSSSVDVYGSPQGYHGAAKALGTFPHSPAQLANQDIIILAGCRVAALPESSQDALVDWVNRGGGLLITGGPLSLDCDKYGRLADILPVQLNPADELHFTGGTALQPLSKSGLSPVDWSAAPKLFWINANATPRSNAKTLLAAKDVPVLLSRRVGKGSVAVFTGTVCGDPRESELAFWDWPQWPRVLADVLTQVAPTSPITGPVEPKPDAATRKALARLEELAEDGLGALLGDDDDFGIEGGEQASGKELVELAQLTQTTAYADAVVASLAAGNAALTHQEAMDIFNAVRSFVTTKAAAKASVELLESTNGGQLILGMRLAGIGGNAKGGSVMVDALSTGRRVLQRDGSAKVGLTVRDGTDEAIRLAAAFGLAKLGNPKHRVRARQAADRLVKTRPPTPQLETIHAEAAEMSMAAVAAMGDASAAAWTIDRINEISLAMEAAIDASEQRPSTMTPQAAREIRGARDAAKNLAIRVRRLRDVVATFPRSLWPGLVEQASEWEGEFATETILLALAARDDKSVSASVKQALASIASATKEPAIRTVCQAMAGGLD